MQEVILTQVKDYVQTLLSKLETAGTISNINDNIDGTYTCVCSSIKNLTEYDHLNFSGNANWIGTYQIKNITSTGFDIIRETGITETTGIEYIKKIYFFFGTPIEDIIKIVNTGVQNIKTPNLVVLYLPIKSKFSPSKPFLKALPLWMAFMKPYPASGKWLNEEYYTNCINPMTYLAYKFMLLVDKQQDYSLTEYMKYGRIKKFEGSYHELLQRVSGVELTDATLKIPKKHTICNFN